MTDDQSHKPARPATREARLAAALRANLSKRKAAGRGKAPAAGAPQGERTETEPADRSE